MPSTPGDLFAMATALGRFADDFEPQSEDSEAFLESLARTVANRAYYACYHFAKDWAESRGYTRSPQLFGSHDGLWSAWYRDEPETDDIMQAGEALHLKRKEADYELKTAFRHKIKDLLQEAEELRDLISEDIDRVTELGEGSLIRVWDPSLHTARKRAERQRRRSPNSQNQTA